MEWDGRRKKQFREALCQVYRDPRELEMFLLDNDFGRNLAEITVDTNLEKRTFQLIQWAESQGLLDELFDTFCRENANNSAVAQDIAELKGDRVLIGYRYAQTKCFAEDLGNGVQLEMTLIPAGEFLMGSPEDEPERGENESPQHRVSVPQFFLGTYPVTQAQWRAVANLPQYERDLKPNPSDFSGDNRPVERVYWFDAVEFCQRLSQHTGRDYRLPSEAEWEYACRAGTQTPFYFGETITTDLANYRGTRVYGRGKKGEFRRETTDVGSFPANGFGLFDMHGNVWEWCADDWHDNYEGAPTDGSAWIDNEDRTKTDKLLRGGSWIGDPLFCRSAFRNRWLPDNTIHNVGFRVACNVAGIL
jgi:formylglycine-generating enzyme required for sulfatase activity